MDKPIPETTTENTNREKDDEEGAYLPTVEQAARNIETETKNEIEKLDYASNLEQLFLQRRGRGAYPSGKDLQAIQEVVQSGIAFEEEKAKLMEELAHYKK